MVRDSVGKIAIPARRETLPLFDEVNRRA